jgi:general secretion pathway protein N
MSPPRLWLAIAAACLIGGQAEGRTLGQTGQTSLAAIENAGPPSDLTGDASPPGASASEAATQPARIGNPLWAIPMRKLSATRERPLFTPSRRPPTPGIAAAPAPPAASPPPGKPPEPERPPLILVGTIIGDNERIAIFVNQLSNETKRVREGEQESGWVVRSVELRTAVLERNHRSVTLDLPKRSEARAPGQMPIPPPPNRPPLGDAL